MRAFRNWARTERSGEVVWERPTSEAEVADVLSRARRSKRRVRPIGSGHSWSPIAVPEDVAIDLSRMSRVLEIDAAARTVRVQAGITLSALNAALHRAGLALPILGSISAQTIAGAISTGTHGSSLVHGNLASLVEELTLVTPTGDRRVIPRGHEHFDACAVSLGALGVITEVVLRACPAFALIGEVESRPILEVARDLDAIAASAEYVKVWWLPGADGAHVFRYLRTPLPPHDLRVSRFIDTHLTNRVVFPAALAIGARVPRWTPAINRVVAASYLERPAIPMRSDLAFNVAMPPIHRETEYAFDMPRAAVALERVATLIERDRIPVNFPVEVRFVREDAAWMSPASGRATCQIGGYMGESADLPRFFSAFHALARELEARPHWGKETDVDADYVRRVYPRRDAFVTLAERWDPDRTLRNAFLDRVLGRDA